MTTKSRPKTAAKKSKTPARKTATKSVSSAARKSTANRPATVAKSRSSSSKKSSPAASESPTRGRDELQTLNAVCDSFANEELGIKAALPEPKTMRGAAAAAVTRSSSWRAAKSLMRLREQVNAKAPARNKSHDGMVGDARHRTRNSDHNPWVDGGVVTAYDVTHDPAKGCDVDRLAERIRSTRDPRVKYLIWRRRIANFAPIGGAAAWAWRPYGGSNPHDKHLHISVKPTRVHYDNTNPWPV